MPALKTDSIDYLMSSYLILRPIECKERHDKIENYTHWKIYKYYGIQKSELWFSINQNQ